MVITHWPDQSYGNGPFIVGPHTLLAAAIGHNEYDLKIKWWLEKHCSFLC